MGTGWTVEELGENVTVIRFKEIYDGWEQWVMVSGDRHHDSTYCDRRAEREQLDLAKERNAPIIDLGDLFDAMQGKGDNRKNQDALRAEYRGNNYFDKLVNVAADWYEPWADQFAVLGHGNHETKVLKYQETDLTARLARQMRLRTGNDHPRHGQYAGWIFFRFHMRKTAQQTIKMKYHHGHGGGGPVTKGVIQTNRRAVYLPDAHIIATAHIHEAWVVPITQERISRTGRVRQDYQWHISVPTYKDEYDTGGKGYHVEGGRPPKPKGCGWIHFTYGRNGVAGKVETDLV